MKQAVWSYDGETGPAHWASVFSAAGGKKQSPIDIKQNECQYDAKLIEHPLSFSYDTNCFKFVENTGSSFNVTGAPNSQSKVMGGPVSFEYNFLQFHIHWGTHEKEGSEHLIDGNSCEAELHIVNWNSQLYKTPGEAAQSSNNDGLIVLGVLLKLGKSNSEIDKIIPSLYDIPLKGQKTALKDTLDIKKLFPSDPKYWTYKGSLTTPPCSESVTWVVFKEPVEISAEQLNGFRELNNCSNLSECCESTKIKHNYRPTMELNGRKVCKSFD